jgi:hypothetical protein
MEVGCPYLRSERQSVDPFSVLVSEVSNVSSQLSAKLKNLKILNNMNMKI